MSDATDARAGRSDARPPTVPPPVAPDDPDAWYAPNVRAQYEAHPDVVVTITETRDGFHYGVREPSLSSAGERAFGRIREHFANARVERPLTREGATERMAAGLAPKYRRTIDRLVDLSPAARRRVDYHALAELRCLGRLTPYALDDRIDVADTAGGQEDAGCLVVHTEDFAPATTDLSADPPHLGRFASEYRTPDPIFRGLRVLRSAISQTPLFRADPTRTKLKSSIRCAFALDRYEFDDNSAVN